MLWSFGHAEHLDTYVQGQLSKLDRKSVEPIALAAGVAPRTLQQFLNSLEWDQEQLIDTLQWRVARDHTSDRSIGLIDETSCPKKGDKTPGVQRQWCGATGKQDNCVTTVHLGYGVDDFHCLLDSELFLPESWSLDRPRCRAAHIPDEMVYRPKWQIALELYDRAGQRRVVRLFDLRRGLRWKARVLAAIGRSRSKLCGGSSAHVHGLVAGALRDGSALPSAWSRTWRSTPRLGAGAAPAHSVEHHLNFSPDLRDQDWKRWHIKDTQKGPMVWETKHVLLTPKDENGLPDKPLHLVVARNVRDVLNVKYFLSNASRETPVKELLHVAFSRWRIERCFEDQKTELGFDHFEGRSYLGLKRHQAITAVSHLFLSEVQQELRGEKSGADGLPGPHRGGRTGALVGAWTKGGRTDSRSRGSRARNTRSGATPWHVAATLAQPARNSQRWAFP